MNKCVIPISGGLDSTVILHDVTNNKLYDEVHAITFDYGQRHKREIDCAKWQARQVNATSHKILDISFFKELSNISSLTNSSIDVANTRDILGDPQTVNYVPFRNQLLLTICCSYAESIGASTVYHGAAMVDSQAGYWDGSEEFLDSMNSLLLLNRRHKIKIEAPLIYKDKSDIIRLGVKHRVDFKNTYTCYSGEELSDAENPASSSRIQGFLQAGYIDPVPYKQDIPWSQWNCKPIKA